MSEDKTVNLGHAKPFYENSEELQTAIDDYFVNGVPEKDVRWVETLLKCLYQL